MNESIIAGITNFFMACPLLQDGVFRVNALGDQAIEYNIETGVFNPILKKYVNGDTLRQYQFNITIWTAFRIYRTASFMSSSPNGLRNRKALAISRSFPKGVNLTACPFYHPATSWIYPCVTPDTRYNYS